MARGRAAEPLEIAAVGPGRPSVLRAQVVTLLATIFAVSSERREALSLVGAERDTRRVGDVHAPERWRN